MSILGSIANGIFGLVGGYATQKENERNRQYAAEQAEIARRENYQYGEMAANAADKRQRAQFADMFSPAAQMKLIKEAGLSPSIMYQGTGVQGQATGQQGGGANGPSTAMPTIFNPVQGAMQAAQLGQINAQTEKIKAETDEIKGETPLAQARTAEAWANAGYQKEATRLAQFEEDRIKMQNTILEATTEDQISLAKWQAKNAEYQSIATMHEAKSAGLKAEFDEKTLQTKIEQVTADLDFTKSNIAFNKANAQYLKDMTEAKMSEICIEWKKADVYDMSVEKQAEWWTKQGQIMEAQLAQDAEFRQKGIVQGYWKMGVEAFTDITKVSAQYALFKGLKMPNGQLFQEPKLSTNVDRNSPYGQYIFNQVNRTKQ